MHRRYPGREVAKNIRPYSASKFGAFSRRSLAARDTPSFLPNTTAIILRSINSDSAGVRARPDAPYLEPDTVLDHLNVAHSTELRGDAPMLSQ
jgi:hypothetical protein